MIGLDTNVLVRFLVRDDEEQLARAERLIRRSTRSFVVETINASISEALISVCRRIDL
jgi:predicted nucleic-acid-binding protein